MIYPDIPGLSEFGRYILEVFIEDYRNASFSNSPTILSFNKVYLNYHMGGVEENDRRQITSFLDGLKKDTEKLLGEFWSRELNIGKD